MNSVIRKSDKLEDGDEVTGGSPWTEFMGRPLARKGDATLCDKHGPTIIDEGYDKFPDRDGKPVAMHQYCCACGCRLNSSLQNTFFIFLLTSTALVSGSALSQTPTTDTYTQCMARTKHDRLNCQIGCGMIVQQCYDEGIADINNQTAKLNDVIKAKNGVSCANLTANYLSEASRIESVIEKQTANLAGWTGSELSLSFARQRFDNVLLIHKSCK
jgi:uncharacterized Zn-binding protein involved in type VI secretion